MNYIAAIEYIYIFSLFLILMLLEKFFKHKFITKIILFIFCIITTFNTLMSCDFSNKDKNKKYITFLFSLSYSLFWVYCYILLYNTKKYFPLFPVLYLLGLRILELNFDCESYTLYFLLQNNNKSKIKFNNIK